MHDPKPMSEMPDADASLWAHDVLDGRCNIVVGAGVSMADPTCLSSGYQLAVDVKRALSLESTFQADLVGVPDGDLPALGDAARDHSPTATSLLQRKIVELADLDGALPNYGHLILALLMSEGLVHCVSLNWDSCIERTAVTNYCAIVTCSDKTDVSGTLHSARLLKPHGSSQNPGSMRVSTAQMDETAWWINHTAATALAGNRTVFIGLAEVPPYQESTVRELVGLSNAAGNIRVIAPSASKQWTQLLGDDESKWFTAGKADDSLDDLLRAITAIKLGEAKTVALAIVPNIGGITQSESIDPLLARIGEVPAHYLWLWARRGVFPNSDHPAATSATMVNCLLALMLLNSISTVEAITIRGACVAIETDEFIVEFAYSPDLAPRSDLMNKKRSSLRVHKQNNSLPVDKKILVLADGAAGPIPKAMRESIVDEGDPKSVVDGPMTLGDRWVDVSKITAVSSKSELEEMIASAGYD